jgi:REP element-mobilizing transposase RayT
VTFKNKYRIPSARWQTWDYDSNAYYFITICTASKEYYFGEITEGEMSQTIVAGYLEEQIRNVQSHYPYAEIPVFVVMPNHVHLIVCIDAVRKTDGAGKTPVGNLDGARKTDGARTVSTTPTTTRWKTETVDEKMQQIAQQKKLLSVVVGGIKSSITRYANANKITFGWQTRFHDHIIRDDAEYIRISHYINTNIENWENDCFY